MYSTWEILIWLLPLTAVISWWLGRLSIKRTTPGNLRHIHPDYFKGLNYVLNEQPDKAIEIFIKMLEVDTETIETHLALGNLFRRRGEVDRAIRIHQNLIARPSLSPEYRDTALMELAMDYMRSGLLDRAEALFQELVASTAHAQQAFTELLDIYQQEKDWDNAINTARKLEIVSGRKLNKITAQFYCEKAEEILNAGGQDGVMDNLHKALSIDPDCARASLLEGQLLQNDGKLKQAIKLYRRIEDQDPEIMPEAIIPLLTCYRDLDAVDEYIEYLRELIERHGGITAILTLAELLYEKQGTGEAIRFITTEVKKHPTVKGVDSLLQYVLTQTEGSTRESLMSVKELTGRLLKGRSAYKCNHCGFAAKSLHWYCPSCRSWNTIKPVYGLQGE
jgi:lipopolysaccharide biosynthesis regulator YciM